MQEFLDDEEIVLVKAIVYLSKDDRDFAEHVCANSFCTFNDMVQVAVESAIKTMREQDNKLSGEGI